MAGRSSTNTEPLKSRRRSAMHSRRVVFPQPEGPSTAVHSPARVSPATSLRMVCGVPLPTRAFQPVAGAAQRCTCQARVCGSPAAGLGLVAVAAATDGAAFFFSGLGGYGGGKGKRSV